MESKQTYALRICGPLITQNLDPMDVLEDLRSGLWISDTEYRHILWLCSRGLIRDGAVKLLDLIRSRIGSFDCFVNALEERGSFLASEIRRHFHHAPDGRRREHSLSDLRETLIDGAVPDVPVQHVPRRKLVDGLTDALRSLASRFRFKEQDQANQQFAQLSLQPGALKDGNLPSFTTDLQAEQSEFSPPPTNAWLLVHGLPGSGKTVLCTYALRRNPGLLAECFPGGVIWLQVGSLTCPRASPSSPPSSPTRTSLDVQLTALVDRLERKISPSNRFSFGESPWSEYTVNPMLSQSPPSQPIAASPSLSLPESLDRLRRALIKRQQRTTWGPDDEDTATTTLLLIVLDDVWDVEVGRALSTLPAAFLVTSRDQNVLQHVETPVDRFPVLSGFTNEEVAQLLASWTNRSASHFLLPSIEDSSATSSSSTHASLSTVAQLCHGLPLTTTLLGHLLRERYHRLSDYLCDPTGCGETILNWAIIDRPSAYGYETVVASVQKSLAQLPPLFEACYQQLVIFEPNVILTAKVTAILWAVKEDVAERVLSDFARFSLAIRVWVPTLCCYGYMIHPVQLDLLKLSINAPKQATYHARLVENYEQHCSGRWARLVSSGEHVYFWRQATTHLYKSGRLYKLVELMTNLEFLRGCLSVLGTSPVIAEFNRYRVVFAALEQMDNWFAYLRFIQTNAYYIVDPSSARPTERGRSPCRTDSVSAYTLQSISPALRTDGVSQHGVATQAGPKGLDLIQLGLGLPHNSPVFQQAVQRLLKDHEVAKASALERSVGLAKPPESSATPGVSEYYWFWCNSHVAASQLVWAIPTGPQAITCLALEPESQSTKSYTESSKPQPIRYRERFLAATSDGRMLLLDAASGYEVAVQQTYSPHVEVKFLAYLSNKMECLICGSNGNFVVSSLPPPEPIDRVHRPGCRRPHEDHAKCDIANGNASDASQATPEAEGDLMAGVDVDEDIDTNFYSQPSPKPHSLDDRKDPLHTWSADGVPTGSKMDRPSLDADAGIPFTSPNLKIRLPTVLAEIPRVTEVVRIDGAVQSLPFTEDNPSGVTPPDALRCIAAPPDLQFLALSCQRPSAQSDEPLPAIYFLKRTETHLYLDCSRQLRLPRKLPTEPDEVEPIPVPATLATVSADGRYVAVVLQDSHIWIYSMEEIGWLACFSPQIALTWIAEVGPSIDRKRSSDLFVRVWKRLSSKGVHTASPFACLFLSHGESHSGDSNGSTSSTLFVAAVATDVLLWDVPNTLPTDETILSTPESLGALSKPVMLLGSSTMAYVLCLDSCILAGQQVLAGGTTNGRVLFWRVRDGCRLFELTAHTTWVTAIKLLPLASTDQSARDPYDQDLNLRNAPLGVLTASAAGLIKRWDVGAACLPSPTTPVSGSAPWPNAPPPLHRISAELERPLAYTNVHGLWTDVFSVWFGLHGSLLVVGRRRHSADLQFLFRPQQSAHNRTENPFTFQEVTMKPSQPFYWRPQKPTILIRSSYTAPSKVTSPPRLSGDINASNRSAPRPALGLNKHWITTTGLPGTMHGRATAVSFWPCGRWVAVGFSTGIVQVLSLHSDETHLYGIAKRFSLVDNRPVSDSNRPTTTQRPVDRVVYLHTWESMPDSSAESYTLVVLAVFASGSVAFWHIANVSLDPKAFDPGCPDIGPEGFWPPMHSTDSTDYQPGHKLSEREVQSRVISDTDVAGLVVPVTWSTLREIPHWSRPDPDARDTEQSPPARRVRPILVWLTAGYDGLVFGRQIVFPASSGPVSEIQKRPNREFLPWRFDLEAHVPGVITDADVDPTGEWLITASTDRTARVWSLVSASLVFETAKHPDCVRTVCFRPVYDRPGDSALTEWFFGTGDDTGTLRIWALNSRILQHERSATQKPGHLSRALSPDIYARPSFSRSTEALGPTGRVAPADAADFRRHPSPDMKHGFGSPTSTPVVSLPPRFHSSAAGYGGSWLRRLVWSSDGRLLAGLSDRLCVWPFEPSVATSTGRPGPGAHLRPGGTVATSTPAIRRPVLHKCRVLRVLSSGITEAVNCSLKLLNVSCRRQIYTNGSPDISGDQPSDLPPTLVTVDVNTGTLYIFDPIGALFRSQLMDE